MAATFATQRLLSGLFVRSDAVLRTWGAVFSQPAEDPLAQVVWFPDRTMSAEKDI